MIGFRLAPAVSGYAMPVGLICALRAIAKFGLTGFLWCSMSCPGFAAGLKGSDAVIKQKLLGYWSSGRHVYLVKANGMKYMLAGETKNRWDVRNGVYYEDGEPYDITTLTQQQFAFRSRRRDRITFELQRISYEQGEKIRGMDAENSIPAPDQQPGPADPKQSNSESRTGAATGTNELTAAEAARHVGQRAVVTGVVTDVAQSRAHLHLCLGGTADKPDMYVFVPSFGDTDIFPDYFRYRNATITVTGTIQRRSGYLGIDVTDPGQIVARTEGLTDHLYLGHMKQKRGDLDGAMAEYDQAIAADTKNASAFSARASARAEKGEADAAIADYNRAIELAPTDSSALLARAHLKLITGQFDSAIADYNRVMELFPRWGEPYNQRAGARKAKGDNAGAIEDYQTGLHMDPTNPIYRKNLEQAQAAGRGQQVASISRAVPQQQPAITTQSPASKGKTSIPKSAEIVDIAPGQAELGIKAGNVRLTYEDGRVEPLTYTGNCMDPHVFPNGLVGWLHCEEFDRKGYPLKEKVVVRLPTSFTKEFAADPKAPFIEGWAFDNGTALVIESRGFHGPASYIRYDLATGRVTNRKEGRNDEEPLPPWAKGLADSPMR